jgi:hypothetical protein
MANPAEQKIQLKLIKEILNTHTLLNKIGSYDSGPQKPGAKKVFEKLSSIYTIVGQQSDFSRCFDQDEFDSFDSNNERIFALREIERESNLLPVLGVTYKIMDEGLSISFRTGLFQMIPLAGKDTLAAFGYRFESPSFISHKTPGADGKKIDDKKAQPSTTTDDKSVKDTATPHQPIGSHNFFHAQPIQVFKKGVPRYKLPECPTWFTEKQPSFPLDANCPVTLTLAFLIGIYGMRFWEKISEHQNLRDRVKTKFKELHYLKWNALNPN